MRMKEVGPYLQQHVREKCRLGRLQPLILFYEREGTETAVDRHNVEQPNSSAEHDWSEITGGQGSWPTTTAGDDRRIYGHDAEPGRRDLASREKGRKRLASPTGTIRSTESPTNAPGGSLRSHPSLRSGYAPAAPPSQQPAARSSRRAHLFGLYEDRRLDEGEDEEDDCEGMEESSPASSPAPRRPRQQSLDSSISSSSSSPHSPMEQYGMGLGGGALSYKRFEVGPGFLARRKKYKTTETTKRMSRGT